MTGRRSPRDGEIEVLGPDAGAAPPRLRVLRRVALLLDEAVAIPGTGIRVGLDPLLGLLPGFGDVAGGLLSLSIVAGASRAGVPNSVLLRMLGNIALDTVFGALPILGDLFDAGWKANARNVRLLDEALAEPAVARRESRHVVLGAAVGLVVLLVLCAAGTVWFVKLLLGAMRQ